jgi:O-antigen/teichoic acid export membrane protein
MRRYRVPLAFSGCSKELSILWKFSTPAMLGGMLVGPVNWACNALLVNQPKGYMEMGIFQAANQCFAILLFLPLQLSRVILPVLSERLGQQDVSNAKKIMCMVKLLYVPVIIVASASNLFVHHRIVGGDFKDGLVKFIVFAVEW